MTANQLKHAKPKTRAQHGSHCPSMTAVRSVWRLDVRKIGAPLYQYTAIDDDCSRYPMIGVFQRKTAASTLTFPQQLAEEMPLSIQRIPTDWGQEFYRVQDRLRLWSVKFRPIRPRACSVFRNVGTRCGSRLPYLDANCVTQRLGKACRSTG